MAEIIAEDNYFISFEIKEHENNFVSNLLWIVKSDVNFNDPTSGGVSLNESGFPKICPTDDPSTNRSPVRNTFIPINPPI